MALALGIPQAAAEEEEVPKQEATEEAPVVAERPMEVPIMEGEPVHGIRIPHYGEDGSLQMYFDAEVAERTDANQIEMRNLKIEVFDEEDGDMLIALPSSILDLNAKTLAGGNGVVIKRADFEVEGEQLEFHIPSRFGKLLGNVRMVIYSSQINE